MRHLFFTLLIVFSFQKTKTRNYVMLAKYTIATATHNCDDISEQLIEEKAYLAFYSDNSNKLYMGNHWIKSKTESFGPIDKVDNSSETEDDDAEIFYFDWKYENSYDNKKGIAKVKLMRFDDLFILKIVPENLNTLVYYGFIEGDVDFSGFEN